MYLGIRAVCKPTKFTVIFGDWNREQWGLTVHGRNLRPIFTRIVEHRIRRLKADRDFPDQNNTRPIILRFEIEDITVEK